MPLDVQKATRDLRIAVQSACLGQPVRQSVQVLGNHFVVQLRGDPDNWPILSDIIHVPAHASGSEVYGKLTRSWVSHADVCFGRDGILSRMLPNYEMRKEQLYGARFVQRASEMGETAVIEAGTGTGKSLMYLLPARAMGKKVIVSTSNKLLQLQLAKKDAPFVSQIFPSKIALIQGKNNYACMERCQGNGEINKVSRELHDWYFSTESGNVQEIEFQADPRDLEKITTTDCVGRACSFYDECFYYKAKHAADNADIIICNHMLLALHQKFEKAQILPTAGMIVVDEAHQFGNYITKVLGDEVTTNGVKSMCDTLRKYDVDAITLDQLRDRFDNEFFRFGVDTRDNEVAIKHDRVLVAARDLAMFVQANLGAVWNLSDKPETKEDRKQYNTARRLMVQSSKLLTISEPTKSAYARWVNREDKAYYNMPLDISDFVGAMCGFRRKPATDRTVCYGCGAALGVSVSVLSGNAFCMDCITEVDVLGDAEPMNFDDWIAIPQPEQVIETGSNVIFTSATLGTPTLEPFLRGHGINHALTCQLKSPFDYKNNAMLYTPDGNAPAAKSSEFLDFMVEQMNLLVNASKGGAFLLFTSNASLKHAVTSLRRIFERAGYPCFVQGENYTKAQIVSEMKREGNGVLFGTKSFFEGADIPGRALRLVVVDKMPFAAPSPFNTAQDEYIRDYARKNLKLSASDLEYYPFNHKRVPDMTIDLKQAAGRLIRTATDTGVIVVLDNRMTTTRYGRQQVLVSLPDAPRASTIQAVVGFFERNADHTPLTSLSPLDLAKELYKMEELPF